MIGICPGHDSFTILCLSLLNQSCRTASAQTAHDFVSLRVHAVHPLGIDLNACSERDACTLEVGCLSLLVVGLHQVVQMVYESEGPGVLGCDLVLCGQLDTLLIQG